MENIGIPAAIKERPRILVAPLDWGLGHATRCIPIIHSLLQKGCEVWLAGEGRVKTLLQKEFPALPLLPLPGYNIRYSRKSWLLPLKIGFQIPQMLRAIDQEHKWLHNAARQYRFNGIISDNRYGLYHESLPTVFITHQLCIQTGMGHRADSALQHLHYRMINRFGRCWVPDHAGAHNLAGALSHPRTLPRIATEYIGPLSRFNSTSADTHTKGSLLFLLSGPEPQRTLFEKLLICQLHNYRGKAVLIRGLPGDDPLPELPEGIEVFNHLDTASLQQKMLQSEYIVARSGYSTVMDLAALRRKGILIPTPGQSEQAYLATYLMQEGRALCIPQEKFRLQPALHLAASFRYRFIDAVGDSGPGIAISNFVQTCLQRM